MDKSERDEIENLIDFGDDAKTSEKETPETQDLEQPETMPDLAEVIEETDDEDIYDIADIDSDIDDYDSDITPDPNHETAPERNHIESDDLWNDEDFDFNYSYTEDKPRPKSKAFRIIRNILITAAVIAFVIIFIITDTGIIGAYKRNFKHNFSRIFNIPEKPTVTETVPEDGGEIPYTEPEVVPEVNETVNESVYTENGKNTKRAEVVNMAVKTSAIIPYEFASESDYSAYGDGVVCASTNYMCCIDGNGEIIWECATSVIDPILKTAGNYILIAQENGTKLCLYEGSKLIYDTDCEGNILSADLSKKGDCVLVTTKDLYKGAIAAYNKSGNLIFARSSGGGSVIDASISPSSRNIAVALLDTDEAVRSTVEIFDITKNDPIFSFAFDDTILFDVEYFKNTVNAFGDNSSIGITPKGEVLYDMRFDGADLNHYAYDKRGNKLLLLSAAHIPTFMVYNVNGREKASLTALEMADYLCIGNGRIMYNNDREIIIGKPKGRTFSRYTASMDIRRLIMVNKNTFFIVYSNSLELVRM